MSGIDELTVGRAGETELSCRFFGYAEKYTLQPSKIYMPARIDAEAGQRIQKMAVAIYRALGCSGFARVDMFYTPSGRGNRMYLFFRNKDKMCRQDKNTESLLFVYC